MLLSVLVFTGIVQMDTTPIPVRRTDVAPVLDGLVNDRVWSDATSIDSFIQRTPRDGSPSSERTEILLVYTATTLYVGVRAFDAHPERIIASAMRRDDPALIDNDQFAMTIDAFGDGRNGVWLSTNALGARSDEQFVDEGAQWIDWNGDWDVRSRRTETGWSAELAIPFATLRFRRGDVVVMGMNFFRRIVRTHEQTFSPHIPVQYEGGTATVSLARRFAFRGIGGRALGYVRPYALAGSKNAAGTNSGRNPAAGGEAQFNMSPNAAATVTFNTDFAQVEADERQINLTRFDLFFPEKRQFFLEDGGVFAFGVAQEAEVFFSRRIGLASDSGGLRPVPVRFGAKAVARAGRVEFGALDMRSSGDSGAVRFGMVRLKAGVAPKSYVGGIVATASGSSVREATVGADFLLYLDGATGVRGFGGARVNAAATARERESTGYDLELFRTGARLAGSLGILAVGQEFLPASGFIARPGTRRLTADLGAPWYPASGTIRRVEPRVTMRQYEMAGGAIQTRIATVQGTLDFRTVDKVILGATRSREVVDAPFQVFRGYDVPAGDYGASEAFASVLSNPARRFSVALNGRYGDWLGGRKTDLGAQATWKTSRFLTVQQGYQVYVAELPSGAFTAWTLQSRADVALNTKFSVIGISQYDNNSRKHGVNVRAQYQFREGTEILLATNDQWDHSNASSRPVGAATAKQQTILLKATYRLTLP